MILNIETHLDITPDILHDISIQLEQGLSSGLTPYHWSIKKDPSINHDLFDSIDNDIEDAIDAIRNTEASVQRLRDLLTD